MHNYEKKILALQAAGKVPSGPGKFYDCKVSHDDWCNVYRSGECNCDPEITYTEITDKNRDQVAKMITDDSAEFRKKIEEKKV